MHPVLILDDDPDILEMVSLVLTSYGLEVKCIEKGNALMPAINAFQPSVLLMDIYLTDADGRDLCYELKTSTEYAHIPVILYSAGNIESSTVERSKADSFFAKPFNNKELVHAIKSLI